MNYSILHQRMQTDTSIFWAKVERAFGEIPKLIKIILEFNGFDTHLALKGIRWDDKKVFFQDLEESISSIVDLDDSDGFKQEFFQEIAANKQKIQNFKLKLGHKNLIINLCHELQKTNLEDFNGSITSSAPIQQVASLQQELVVHKSEEHRYSREQEEPTIKHEIQEKFTEPSPSMSPEPNMHSEQVEFIYESENEEDGHFEDHEYLEAERYDGDLSEVVQYQEVQVDEEAVDNEMYEVREIVKTEDESYEQSQNCFDYESYDNNSAMNRSSSSSTGPPKAKKPKHMYTAEFLSLQMTAGRIGVPGRRRPKIQKQYAETDEGDAERWMDLVRQSCEVIIPHELLTQYDLSNIELEKVLYNIWEVKCPLCTKKLRLQSTQEGKYMNYKRSNFERHLRIVHYKQIKQYKDVEDEAIEEELVPY